MEPILKKEEKMDINKIDVGSVCIKTKGRDTGECVILEIKENRALVTGPKSLTGVRRRYINLVHLNPTGRAIKIQANESDEKVAEALGKKLPTPRPQKEKQKTATPKKEIKRLRVPKKAPKKEAPKKPERPKRKERKTLKTAKPKKPKKTAKKK